MLLNSRPLPESAAQGEGEIERDILYEIHKNHITYKYRRLNGLASDREIMNWCL